MRKRKALCREVFQLDETGSSLYINISNFSFTRKGRRGRKGQGGVLLPCVCVRSLNVRTERDSNPRVRLHIGFQNQDFGPLRHLSVCPDTFLGSRKSVFSSLSSPSVSIFSPWFRKWSDKTRGILSLCGVRTTGLEPVPLVKGRPPQGRASAIPPDPFILTVLTGRLRCIPWSLSYVSYVSYVRRA